MLSIHLKTAWRYIRKGKLYSVINIAGLAIGIACSITIGLYVYDEYSFDKFHTYHDNIYRVVETQDHEGILHPVAATPGMLADKLKKDYPEVIQTCRISRPLPGLLSWKTLAIEPSAVIATDNSFFSMFDFELLAGNADKVLQEPDEIIISEKIAERLFGAAWRQRSQLLGEQLIVANNTAVTIAGVVENCPANSHIQFDVILPMKYEEIRQPNNFTNWGNHNYHTYISLNEHADPIQLEEKLKDDIVELSEWSKPVLRMQQLDDIYLHSHFDYGDWVKTGSATYLSVFTAVGIVILLIAIFNFVNLAIARATQRAKEVGVRKVIGAVRKQLVVQFLGESLLITLLSVALALLLLIGFVPIVNDVSDKTISIPLTPTFALIIVGIILLMTVLSGIYPALLLSGIQPAKALKGLFRIGTGQFFRRMLVVAQFSFSVALILATIVIYGQLKFIQQKDLGFDKEQLVFLSMKNQLFAKAKLLKSDLENETSIASLALTSHNLTDVTASTHSVYWEGKTSDDAFPFSHLTVDADMVPTAKIQVLAGRNFDKKLSSDSTSWLINETAAARMGWTANEAIGKPVKLWDTQGTVAGVIKDFHFRPLTKTIEPMLLKYWPGNPYNYRGVLIRAKQGQVHEAVAAIERLYKKYEQQTEPDYRFVDDSLNQLYRTERATARTILYFSLLAILVACLGLFALTTLSAEQRTREIGIRKVLGASAPNIVNMLSKDFMGLVGIATFISLPLSIWAMWRWLGSFAYHIDVQWWMVVLTIATVVIIAFATTSFQAIRAAISNPVKALRSE